MDHTFTFSEKRKISSKRKTLGTDIGVFDRGIYYLTAILLKDITIGDYVVINRKRRLALQKFYEMSIGNSFYKYILGNIINTYTTVYKWRKWADTFLRSYERKFDIILSAEAVYANDILEYQDDLLRGIDMCDLEEEYVSVSDLERAFQIEEMINAVKAVLSSHNSRVLDEEEY